MADTAPLLVVGASDQGVVVLDLLRRLPSPPPVLGLIDSSLEGTLVGTTVAGLRVMGSLADLAAFADRAGAAVPAVGSCAERHEIAAELDRHGIPMRSLVHPSAIVSPTATVGAGTVVSALAMIGPEAAIGRAVIINSAAVVEHHVVIGDAAHVAPGAQIAGHARIGDRAWIGIGATLIDQVVVGDDAVVGAGAVVVADVPPAVTVVGVPARPIGRGDSRR